jgi:DNA-binding beta-propeller fold protein YncE
MKQFLWLGLALSLYLVITGCGDTFRPIIIPNPPVFPNPAAAHTVVSINDNGTIVAGSAMVVDVSGDTDVSVANVGLAPVHAVQQTASVILVANHSVTGVVSDSITKLNFSSTTIAATSTISLPANSAPNFVAVAPSATTAYVSLPGYAPPSVGVVDTGTNSLVNTIAVGSKPDAIAVTPNNTKVYVANQGDNTVDGFTVNTVNLTPRVINGSFNAPLWLSPRSDSQRVYVLNGNGVVSTIDTTSTAGPDSVIDASINVPGAAYMLYDGNLNRLYIPYGTALAIIDVSQSIPQPIATISIPQIPSLPPVTALAVAVASLPDGSRAYVASVPAAAQPTQVSISGVMGDGTTATYSYMLTGGYLAPGIQIAVSGTTIPAGFTGTFTITAASGTSCATQVCTFQTANTTVASQTAVTGQGASTINNLFPQVTEVNTVSNTAATTIAMPGFPDATVQGSPYYAPVCATTRDTVGPLGSGFRFMMAAGGDSTRAYFASCDGGVVDIIDTSAEQYVLNLAAPVGTLPPIPPNPQNPPQNPVFLLAGP